ncbi:MAG: glutamine amidotransferase [Desulfotomaculum sp.]|nr:glutamine amidotransferase [Desulfotomaculum sp.]
MLTVCHLYPDLLNLYGDRGNVIAFLQRCRWRNIPVQLLEVNLGETVDFNQVDFLFLGGGSDREQNLISDDLGQRKVFLHQAIEDGLIILAICGGYQLLGQYYRTLENEVIPGLGLLDYYTVASTKRFIGNVAIELNLDNQILKVTGFENHAGKTHLGNIEPLGNLLSGYGNNGKDGTEGARYKNVFCSYLHGPLLPKNSVFTDHLIKLALCRRNMNKELISLNDEFEKDAHKLMLSRLKLSGGD